MREFNVFVTDTLWPDLTIERKMLHAEGAEVVLASAGTPREKCEEGSSCDALIVNKNPMTRDNLAIFKNCKILVRMGIGYNEVDVPAATDCGIIVCNVPDYCQNEVADHTVALLLDVSRKICLLSRQTRAGGWDASVATNVPRYEGKTLALLGCGGIGRMVAKRAQSFGIKTAGYDPYLPEEVFRANDIEKYDSIEKLLRVADFVSLHLPLTKESERIINKTTLSYMKKGAFLVNTSRGGLVDEDDLYDALVNGRIEGAALDVLQKEPPSGVNRLAELDNVVITPHAAWNSADALPELRKKVAAEIVRFMRGERPKNVVNKDVLKLFPELK